MVTSLLVQPCRPPQCLAYYVPVLCVFFRDGGVSTQPVLYGNTGKHWVDVSTTAQPLLSDLLARFGVPSALLYLTFSKLLAVIACVFVTMLSLPCLHGSPAYVSLLGRQHERTGTAKAFGRTRPVMALAVSQGVQARPARRAPYAKLPAAKHARTGFQTTLVVIRAHTALRVCARLFAMRCWYGSPLYLGAQAHRKGHGLSHAQSAMLGGRPKLPLRGPLLLWPPLYRPRRKPPA